MSHSTTNVRGLLMGLSNLYGRQCSRGFDIFLIQTLHRKVKFDWHLDYYGCQLLIDRLYDVMEEGEYTEETAEEMSTFIESILVE